MSFVVSLSLLKPYVRVSRIRLSRGHLRRGIHSQSRALQFGSRPQLRSLFSVLVALSLLGLLHVR
jgi:hypothetical protein